MLHDDDRFFVLGAINSLSHLAAHPENDRFIFDVEPASLERLLQLFLLNDEEMQLAILEFLNKYSAFSEDTSFRLAHLPHRTAVKLLFQVWHELYLETEIFPTLWALPFLLSLSFLLIYLMIFIIIYYIIIVAF